MVTELVLRIGRPSENGVRMFRCVIARRPRTLLTAALLASAAALAAGQTGPTSAQPAVLAVPDGFSVSVFASGLTGARLMVVSPEGILVVARRAEVVALPDAHGDGQVEPTVLLAGLS